MKIAFRIAIGLGLACLVLFVAALSSPTQLAAQGIPPRPTLTPHPTLTAVPSAQTEAEGALIELDVPTRQLTLWTVVEWQDSLGGWHAVEGWQGILDEINSASVGRKVWWVSRAEMGKGPFRWQVYQSRNGPLLVTSRLFELPRRDGEIVRVEVSLQP